MLKNPLKYFTNLNIFIILNVSPVHDPTSSTEGHRVKVRSPGLLKVTSTLPKTIFPVMLTDHTCEKQRQKSNKVSSDRLGKGWPEDALQPTTLDRREKNFFFKYSKFEHLLEPLT